MAEKRTAMGDDPLAWLVKSDTAVVATKAESKATLTTDPNTASTTAKTLSPKTDTDYVEQSFLALADNGQQLVADFYAHLFDQYPELIPLFEGVSAAGQHKKLLTALTLLIKSLREPQILEPYLKGLGSRHQSYGVKAEDYSKVTRCLLTVLAQHLGNSWTRQVNSAWTNTLNAVVESMLDAYESVEDQEMAASTTHTDEQDFVSVMAKALDHAVTAIMMIDRDFNISYTNRSMLTLLAEHESSLKQVLPGFNAKGLVGTNIDTFHSDIGDQRTLLSDPNNLPYSTDITIGPVALRLNVSAMHDQQNEYVGNMLECHDITIEKPANADIHRQLAAINNVMGVISFELDGTIIDINDNLLDVVGYSRDEVIGNHHRMFIKPEQVSSPEYDQFWAKLNQGECESSDYHWLGRNGKEIWLQASYIPLLDRSGKPYKVVNYAVDITEQKQLKMAVQHVLETSSKTINAMAEGDLTQFMQGEHEEEFTLLQQAINDTVINLSATIQNVTDASVNITSAAVEISQGHDDLSQRTEQQARMLKQTASSMATLTSAVGQHSDNAHHVHQLATELRDKAEKADAMIENTMQAMTAMHTTSRKVADIIDAIDDIAFQTNMLGLNAAVEAARAGQQGQGFAVIAAEIRNLAQQSTAAVKAIKALMSDKAKQGSALVNESARSSVDMTDSVKNLEDITAEMVAVEGEQTSAIEQINKAVAELNKLTKQNTALVEAVAVAGEVLIVQGKSLQNKMAFFNTGQTFATAPLSQAGHLSTRSASVTKTDEDED